MRTAIYKSMVLISIDKRSTKADIIDSAQELIGTLEEQLDKEQKKSIEASEQRNSLIWILLLTFTISVLF
jgi:hypothetical protein